MAQAGPERPAGPIARAPRTCALTAMALLAVAGLGCAARTPTPATAPATAASGAAGDPDQLRRDLAAMFAGPGLDHIQWGVNFYSVRQATTLYALNASRFLVPASNQKLLITAAAVDRLGWDYRFTTRLLSTAAIDAEGSIDGDVIVTGDGDPTINTRDPQRWRAFDDWAAALRSQGLKRIKGRLVGDDNAFAEPGWGVGWAWDNLQYGYGAQVSALQFNENQVEVIVVPGMTAGAPAIIATTPAGSGLVIDNAVVTAPPGERTSIDIDRLPGTPHLRVRGQLAVDARPASTFASVDDPTRFYLNALRAALGRHGITVDAGVVDGDALEKPPINAECIELVVDRSPTLADILDVALKWSRNIYAEAVLLAMAPRGGPATGAAGLQVVAEALERWGLSPQAYLARDGSGLSRYDYLSADAITFLLRRMLEHETHNAPFQNALPVAGVSGTIAARMKGTAGEGRVRAKSGTLSNVRALSGYATTLDGDTIVFSMIANNFRVTAAQVDDIMDAAVNRVLARKQ